VLSYNEEQLRNVLTRSIEPGRFFDLKLGMDDIAGD